MLKKCRTRLLISDWTLAGAAINDHCHPFPGSTHGVYVCTYRLLIMYVCVGSPPHNVSCHCQHSPRGVHGPE